ncbi:MAG TPA: hypothetical protein VJ757_15730 [Pseudonocardiaceae bacterium]|nr:hypothetical protein [Pseudonocardiaceae bacterium]
MAVSPRGGEQLWTSTGQNPGLLAVPTGPRRHVRGWGLRLITVIGTVLALVFAGMGQAVAHQPGSVKPRPLMPGGRRQWWTTTATASN